VIGLDLKLEEGEEKRGHRKRKDINGKTRG
jgi:hypothetical protein